MRPSILLTVSRLWGVLLLGAVCPSQAAPDPAVPITPAALTDAQLRRWLKDVHALKSPPREPSETLAYPQLELKNPYLVIMDAAHEQPEPGHVLAALSKQYALSPTAARDLLQAQFLAIPPKSGNWTRVSVEEIRTALGLYVDAARQAPGNPILLASALDLPMGYALPAPEYQARVLEILDTAPDPITQALAFAKVRNTPSGWNIAFAALAVSRQPETLERALAALGTQEADRDATLFYLAAYQALRSRPAEPLPPALAERLLINLLDEGQLTRALEVFRQLPTSRREELLAGGLTAKDPSDSFRLDLAGALLLMGEAQEARVWRDAAVRGKSKPQETPHGSDECEFERKRTALAAHLEARPGSDPFPLFLMIDHCQREPDHPWTLLFTMALQGTYPEDAHAYLNAQVEAENERRRRTEPVTLPLRARLSFLDEAQRLLEAGDQERLARLQTALAAVPTPPATPASPVEADPMTARIRELLEAPASSAFTEHPLTEAPKLQPATRWTPPRSASTLPPGFHPLRAERSGKRVLLLAVSQRLDPTGEVSGGGYWLLESPDEGRTWGVPLYTGLREYRPYELASKSSLPMLEGDTVRLEASVRELDERRITFPPIGLSTKREKRGLFLQARLSALRQDTDGDGLTDLTEERLLTDPKRADTDGDGLADGEDPLPQVPATPRDAAMPRARLLSALLAELRGGDSRLPGLEVGLPEQGTPAQELRLPKGPTPESQQDVLFLELERGTLGGAWMPSRTLVLSPEEVSRAGERFGQFYPLRIHLRLNVKGDEALIEWDEHWRGGSYLAHWEKGRWVLESRGQWIS